MKNIRVVSGNQEIAEMSHVHQRDYQGGFRGDHDSHAAADAVDAIGLANARLIAAAPGLLAACKLVKQWMESGLTPPPNRYEVLAVVSQAIAKAENHS